MKLLVVDDHPLMLDGLVQMAVQALPDHQILPARSLAEAMVHAESDPPPCLVLLDPGLPDTSGAGAIRRLVSALPGSAVAVISANDHPPDQEAAWAAGAQAFMSKAAQPQELIGGLQALSRGERVLITRQHGRVAAPEAPLAQHGLSARQLEVLEAVCQGLSNKVIAQQLDISEKTVKAHVTAIFERLQVVNRTQAALAARRLHLVRQDLPAPD